MTGQALSTVTAIVPCNDVDAGEAWWGRLGFARPADQAFDQYRMLSDGAGGCVHLQPAVEGWLIPGRNPFAVDVTTPRVDEIAVAMSDCIIGDVKAPEHKEWGMYEVALNGPDELLVRVGWPSWKVRQGTA